MGDVYNEEVMHKFIDVMRMFENMTLEEYNMVIEEEDMS